MVDISLMNTIQLQRLIKINAVSSRVQLVDQHTATIDVAGLTGLNMALAISFL
jgi:hypothetical protein